MKIISRKLAGLAYIIGIIQFLLILIIAESYYPGYSISDDYISDLGIGPTALLFNSSIALLGIIGCYVSYVLFNSSKGKAFSIFLLLSSLGALGVGFFPENLGLIHIIFAFMAFGFGSLTLLAFYQIEKSLLGFLSIVLGLFSLSAIFLFATNNNFGIGPGGMERMIVYPILAWGLVLGSYLISCNRRA